MKRKKISLFWACLRNYVEQSRDCDSGSPGFILILLFIFSNLKWKSFNRTEEVYSNVLMPLSVLELYRAMFTLNTRF